MCFTMDIFGKSFFFFFITLLNLKLYFNLLIDYTPWGKLWIFIGFQYFIFTFMALFAYLVEDIPEEVFINYFFIINFI